MIILVLRTKVDLQFVPFGDNPCKYEYTVCLKKNLHFWNGYQIENIWFCGKRSDVWIACGLNFNMTQKIP